MALAERLADDALRGDVSRRGPPIACLPRFAPLAIDGRAVRGAIATMEVDGAPERETS